MKSLRKLPFLTSEKDRPTRDSFLIFTLSLNIVCATSLVTKCEAKCTVGSAESSDLNISLGVCLRVRTAGNVAHSPEYCLIGSIALYCVLLIQTLLFLKSAPRQTGVGTINV